MTAGTGRQEIRQAIQASGKTQEEVAAAIGISPVTLSRWLNGHADPAFDKLDQLAAAIGRTIVLSFGPDTEKQPSPEGRLEVKLDIALWALRVTSEEQADLLARRARGEAWPQRAADVDPPAEVEREANVQ